MTYLSSGIIATRSVLNAVTNLRWLIYLFAVIGLAAHSAELVSEVVVAGMLQMSLLNSVSACVWLTISVLLISGMTKPIHSLFMFFMPAGALLLLLAMLLPQEATPKAYSTGMVIHIFISLLAYSVMIIATLQAILVNIQSNHLHNHQFNSKISNVLPPLQSMERLMFEWVILGFVLLTAAIITGGLYVENILAQHLIHKTVLTLIAWLFFALLIFGHFYLGWRGKYASRLIYVGFSFLIVAFLGSKFVLEYLLKLS